MKLKNLFSKAIVDPMIGKIVTHFTTHGCMGTEHEFDYIGKIRGFVYKELYGSKEGKKFYKVEVYKDRSGEKRDKRLIREIEEIPSWYIQDIGGGVLVSYD